LSQSSACPGWKEGSGCEVQVGRYLANLLNPNFKAALKRSDQFIASGMKDEYINAEGNDVTQSWLDYVATCLYC